MKNLMKFAAALVMFASVATYANESDFNLKVKEGSGKAISFTMNETKDVHVSLYALDGSEIFDETIKNKDGKVSRTYDLNALPTGTYFFETETATKVARQQITVEGTKTVVSEEVTEIYKPVVASKDGIVTVSILNNAAPVQIKVYDDSNNEVYSETFEGTTVAKRFDISRSIAKNFTLVMSYNDKQFVETVAAR
jgi:hypothetical protein